MKFKRLLQNTALVIFLALGLMVFASPLAGNVYANDVTESICDPAGDGSQPPLDSTACKIKDAQGAESAIGRIVSSITQFLVFIIGGLSVLMVVIGGLMYVLSGGDSNNTKRAKDTILYAIIGLVVALVAQGLVTFVLSKL